MMRESCSEKWQNPPPEKRSPEPNPGEVGIWELTPVMASGLLADTS